MVYPKKVNMFDDMNFKQQTQNNKAKHIFFRSFYSYETAETLPDECDKNECRSNFLWPKAATLLEFRGTKKEKKSGNHVTTRLTSRKTKSKSSKHVSTKDQNGIVIPQTLKCEE